MKRFLAALVLAVSAFSFAAFAADEAKPADAKAEKKAKKADKKAKKDEKKDEAKPADAAPKAE